MDILQQITLYIIPDNVLYIDRNSYSSYMKTSVIDPDVPTILVINDSFKHYGKEFMLVYKDKIQQTSGGGSCYNPKHPSSKKEKYIIESIGKYWSKDIPFSYQYIWSRICAAKFDLVKKVVGRDNMSTLFYWNVKEYQLGLYGLLAGKLDAIGFGKCDVKGLTVIYTKPRLLLQERL